MNNSTRLLDSEPIRQQVWIGRRPFNTYIPSDLRNGYAETYEQYRWTHFITLTVTTGHYCGSGELIAEIHAFLRRLALHAQEPIHNLWTIEWGKGGRIHAHMLLNTTAADDVIEKCWEWGSVNIQPMPPMPSSEATAVVRYVTKHLADYAALEADGYDSLVELFGVSKSLRRIRLNPPIADHT